MALKMKFMNGAEQAYLNALETEEYFGGSSRRTLTFEIARDTADLERLDALCTEENLAKIELINEKDGISNIYDGYVLKLKVGVEPVLVAAETPDTPAEYEDRVILKAGKLTYIESRLMALGAI